MKKVGPVSGINIIVFAALCIMILLLTYKGGNIYYKVQNGNIYINWFSGVVIPIKDITEVKLLDDTPVLTRISPSLSFFWLSA